MNDDRIWLAWPTCLHCGRPRQTRCPTCGQAGNDFPLAEYQAIVQPLRGTRTVEKGGQVADARSPVWLMCGRCDEAFVPRFYRCCPACGYDTGEGLQAAGWAVEQLPSRVLLAVYLLIAVLALILLYFWTLFR